jgi:hypothetical protein
MSVTDDFATAFDWDAAEQELSAISYRHIPPVPREWIWKGLIPRRTPVLYVAKGETGKGMLFCLVAAYIVLGLPFPGEDQSLRRVPERVVWISGPTEDDQFEDLAPRFRAAIAYLVGLFGLDPELATEDGAVTLIMDLSQWKEGTPVTLPADADRIAEELARIPQELGGPAVGLVVADSLSALLSDGYTIQSRQGATRVMNLFAKLARKADTGLVILHHLTEDGKVAGSPAVLNALRLAFLVSRDQDEPLVRTITRHKSNIVATEPQQFIITGEGPAVHAELTDATARREERLREAVSRTRSASPAAYGTVRERAAEVAREAGTAVLLRSVRSPDGTHEPRTRRVYASRDAAKDAAVRDAGTALTWQEDARVPGLETAACRRADGTVLAYGVKLAA